MDPNTYTPLQSSNPPDMGSTEAPEPKKSSTALLIFIVAFIVIAGGVVLYLFFGSGRQSEDVTEPTNYIEATVAPTASPTPNLEEEVEEIDVGTDEADFDTVQQEIDQL